MNAGAVGRNMPAVVTLDHLTAMMSTDEHHRYELSPEQVLSIAPPPGYSHAIVATRLTLWLLEIISPGSEGVDTVTKRKEYAAAGIPQYWMVDQDQAQTVTMFRLDGDIYTVQATMPLAWVLDTAPAEHDLG